MILFGVFITHLWYSFVYTVVCLFCNIVCGSLIDSRVLSCQWGTGMSPILSDLIKYCSNLPTYKKQKWANFFPLNLHGSWDISIWNLHNFRVFFSEICYFEFSVSNEIVITSVLQYQSSWKFAPLYFFGWGIQKSH